MLMGRMQPFPKEFCVAGRVLETHILNLVKTKLAWLVGAYLVVSCIATTTLAEWNA